MKSETYPESHQIDNADKIFDETTQSLIYIEQDHIFVKDIASDTKVKYLLPSLRILNDSTKIIPLKFANKNSHTMVNPTGNILTCKSNSLQQVDMDKTISQGSLYWTIYVPQKMLALSVGVKDLKNKKSINFDFSLKKPTHLTFKLDIQKSIFSCWINQLKSNFHTPIVLQARCQWTPFVRIKSSGISMILNSFIEDPQQEQFAAFNPIKFIPKLTEQKKPQAQYQFMESKGNLKLHKISNDKLLLSGQNIVKVIHRQACRSSFNFDFIQFQNQCIILNFTASQQNTLKLFSQRTKIPLLNIQLTDKNITIEKSKDHWVRWVGKSLNEIDLLMRKTISFLKGKQQHSDGVSIQQINLVAHIILCKFQILRPWIGNVQIQNYLYSQFNELSHSGQALSIFQKVNVAFKVPKQLYLNSLPYLKLAGSIKSIKATENTYIGVLMQENNKLSVINAQNIAFKVIDTFLMRGFNKQIQIAQYKKQIENILESDFTKPHIFKILKNCLKYADKIKAPQRLLKQIQKKKEEQQKQKLQKAQTPKPTTFNVDGSLLNTLVMMGFNQKLSTKALTECKNQSLQAAMDLILNKYKDQNINTNTPTKLKNDWQCKVCTLINSKEVSVCTVCEAKAPLEAEQKIEISSFDKQQKAEQKIQNKQQQIRSPIIQNQKLKNFFMWSTGVVFCPLLIAGVFQQFIRFRLIGPNPKYYDNFYIKQNGYIDLVTLKSHDYAHQIDQSQISHLHCLASSPQQLKKTNWGWINIEDFDVKIQSNVQNITFSGVSQSDKQRSFVVNLHTQNNIKTYNSQILFNNVYEEKRRCLTIQAVNIQKRSGEIQQKSDQNILIQKKSYIIEKTLTVPAKGQLIIDFNINSQNSSSIECLFQQIPLSGERSDSKNQLPLIVLSGPSLSGSNYLQQSLYSLTKAQFNTQKIHKNGFVLSHPLGDKFTVSNLVLERKQKTVHKCTGFAYVANQLNKITLNTYAFQFNDQTGKVNVNMHRQTGKYLIVVLNPTQNVEQTISLQSINAFGQIYTESQNCPTYLNPDILHIEFQNQELNNKNISDLFKVQMEIRNLPIDVQFSQNKQILNSLLQKNVPLDLRISLSSKNAQPYALKSCEYHGFSLLNSYSIISLNQPDQITAQTYKQCISNFIQTEQSQFLQILQDKQNLQYRKLIQEQPNIQKFIQDRLLTCKFDKKVKTQYLSFINTFGKLLQDTVNVDQLFLYTLTSQNVTAYGLQLAFVLFKVLGMSANKYLQALQNQTKSIQKLKDVLRVRQIKYLCQKSHQFSTIFSPLYNNLLKPQSTQQSSSINYHFICQKSQSRRKYIIDMMSLYSLDQLILKFQATQQRAKLNIFIQYVNQEGAFVKVKQVFYEESFWAQLCADHSKDKHNKHVTNLLRFNLAKIRARYLIVDLCFAAVPYAHLQKDSDNSPTNQIVPIVSGTYAGQSEFSLSQKFKDVSNGLQLVRKVQNFSKYSLKNVQNTFYYNSEELDQTVNSNKILSLQELRHKQDSAANRQQIIRILMQRPSKQNLNYHFTVVMLLLQGLLSSYSQNRVQDEKPLFVQVLAILFESLIVNQRSLIQQKSIQFIRRLINHNPTLLDSILSLRINSEQTFIQLFKNLQFKDINIEEQVQKLLTKDLTNNSHILINTAWFIKLYKLQAEIAQKLVQTALKYDKYEDILFIFKTSGWTKTTPKILDVLVKNNKTDRIKQVFAWSNSNSQLCEYALNQLGQGNNDIFHLALAQLYTPARKTNIVHLSGIVSYLISSLYGQQSPQDFSLIIGLLNKFGYTSELAFEVIKIFFSLNEKPLYLNELLSSKMLAQNIYQERMLKNCLMHFDNIKQNQNEYSILSDLLLFLFKKQIDLQNVTISFNDETQTTISYFLIHTLQKHLNIGGIQSVKLIDEKNSQFITILYYLSALLKNQTLFVDISKVCLEKLINWLFVNINVNQKMTKTTNCLRFTKIEQLVWKFIEVKAISAPQVFAQVYKKLYLQKKKQYESIRNEILRQNFQMKIQVCNLKMIKTFSYQKQVLKCLIDKQNLFNQILNQLAALNVQTLNQKSSCQQQQLSNLLNLYSNPSQKPKDWLLYKNGAKNHVFKIQYIKSTQDVTDLILCTDQEYTLSKIILGFKFDSTTDKNVCIPKEIKVEAGQTLDKMRLVGRMFEIPDDRYINYSVKLFGFNSNTITSQQVQMHCNKNLPFKYLRLRIKSPNTVSIQDALNIQSSHQSNSISLINFLSIQGFANHQLGPHTSQLVKSLQILSQAQNKQLIHDLFTQETILEAFNKSLLNIASLMKIQNYQKVLHAFLMRICSQNKKIGNQMIQSYLNVSNSDLCSKLASEIIMSNDQEINGRINIYFDFIKQVIQKDNLTGLLPFMKRFVQIVFYATTRKLYQPKTQISQIILNVDNGMVQKLLKWSESSELKNSEENSLILQKFLKCVLTLPEPFKIEQLQLSQILQQLYRSDLCCKRYLLVSLIIDNVSCRSWFMQNKYFQQKFVSTFELIKTNPKIELITQNLQFLTLLSYNQNLKQLINKYQYNLKLFEMLMSKAYEGLLSKGQNATLRAAFVDFIARTCLGSENQPIIASLLKDSIPSIISKGNQKFVGQIFLPLLNSFEKVSICVVPFSQKQNKIITDIANIDYKGQKAPTKSNDNIETQKFRLPTQLLSEVNKQRILSELKKQNYSSGKFNMNLCHTGSSAGLGPTIESSIMKTTKSFLAIFQTKVDDQKPSSYVAVFYNKNKNTIHDGKGLLWEDGSFVAVFQDNKQIFIEKSKSTNLYNSLFQMHVTQDNDSQSQMQTSSYQLQLNCNGNNYGRICYDFNTSFFNIQVLTKQVSKQQRYLKSAQFWTFQASSNPILSSTIVQGSVLLKQIISTNYSSSLFNCQYLSSSSLKSLRYENVYQFPSSITINQLKETLRVLNCQLVDNKLHRLQFTVTGTKQPLAQLKTLQQLRRIKKQTVIIDINANFDNLLQLLNVKSLHPKQQVVFLPRKGILKYFQQNDGIQSMIKVIKKSIQTWSNKQRMQKWLQYVTQLQKFSSFPHFFAMYLKDKETFTLLFNLLAGLPDKQITTKWDELQSVSSQKLLKIVSQILHMDKTSQFRQYAMKNDFFTTILQRLRILTGIYARKYHDKVEQSDQEDKTNNKETEDDGTKKVKKKKGVGYGNDSSSNTKWMKGDNMELKKKQFQVIGIILNIIQNFLDIKHWNMPASLIKSINESALLPFIQDGLRAGTLLQISKHPQKFKQLFTILRIFSKHSKLIPILLPLPINYQPKQIESLESLLKSLENTASIFISCLSTNKTNKTKEEQVSQDLAKDIQETYTIIEEAIQEYKEANVNTQDQQKQMSFTLDLPLDKKYRILMKDLRFDYMDMKESPAKIKHHYASYFTANYTPNQTKMIRLAQQLADISTALPYEHTNAVYVRCDKDRVDYMQALIMGANGTPYGHGAFLFDIYFEDTYPTGPPKVNLTTTGHGKIRFNPNLYACGKVCLSLLGTWRGSASENWDAKVSTLLQVLLSIQAIIMSEQVYFNQPGFQNQQGTEQGQKKNQAYSNVVRYGNVKFAMVQNLKNPPKGFQSIIKRHFYLKQHEIMEECKKWLKYAEKRAANYVGLVNDHNHSWCAQFKKSKTQYKQMLQKAIQELQQEFKKLTPPKISDISSIKPNKKSSSPKKKSQNNKLQQLQSLVQQKIDVSYDNPKQIIQSLEIDINDQKVKDRWSRYIGAMGIDAVSKQSKADIIVFGLGPMAMELVKNIVLSGCRKLTICDDSYVEIHDLSGGFFYTKEDIGKKRLDCVIYKVRQLNAYVKVDTIQYKNISPETLKTYTIAVVTEIAVDQQRKLNEICRANKVKFISADCIGFTCRIINDLGQKFQVLDKNGQQPVQVFIKDISQAQKGVVTLLDGVKNPYEDGEAILLKNVQGMSLLQSAQKSINGTIHKVKVINSKSFQIGNTLSYSPYVRNGIAKNIKTPVELSYKPFSEIVLDSSKVFSDENLQFYDFTKIQNSRIVKCCYLARQTFKKQNNKAIQAWDLKDMQKFIQIFKTIYSQEKIQDKTIDFVRKFALTAQGNLPPLCAFFGGLVCQQTIKAITQKFKPISSEFYIEFSQVVPQLPTDLNQQNLTKIFKTKQSRDEGFEIVVGHQLVQKIKNSKLFMIGSGAIGCQLLKNFAMISFGTGQNGKITLTDPDHIQNSNLNRQFLFREKHISKSKSRTASQSVKLMNPSLINHISALTQRVSDSTKDIFTNKFFEGLTLVANALDNVAARRYVDQRCVENKVALFQSGTLGPKGHVQVIVPYLTQSYGSQNDPVQDGQIPHCTLKMFPEETLHCVQWARDNFGKKFSLQPKALIKVLDKAYKPEKDDIKSLNDSLIMVKKGPKNFDDCINYAITKFYKYYRDDVMQLLYTYPLDAKTKNGEPFWKLPKRPPTPISQFNPQDMLQCTFVSSLAVMIAKIYQVQYPKNFRTQQQRLKIGKLASKIKIVQFVPSDEKAKEILKQSSQKKQEQDKTQKVQELQEQDENQIYKELIKIGTNQFKIKPQEFQKDDDANGHIDFIYAMSNLRAINYKLDPMQWLTVKIKAGRIVPALATTTACVSGLQTIEIIKYLKNIKIDKMKNSYINLAVPSIQMSEPGQVLKKKLTEKLTVNLWDRFDIQCAKDITFGQLYEKLQTKYQIVPIGVLQGMSRIDTGKSQADKASFLKQKVLDKLDSEDNYVDLIVLFSKSKEEDKILEGVPPVRLIFK